MTRSDAAWKCRVGAGLGRQVRRQLAAAARVPRRSVHVGRRCRRGGGSWWWPRELPRRSLCAGWGRRPRGALDGGAGMPPHARGLRVAVWAADGEDDWNKAARMVGEGSAPASLSSSCFPSVGRHCRPPPCLAARPCASVAVRLLVAARGQVGAAAGGWAARATRSRTGSASAPARDSTKPRAVRA
jgi:hypothetical protein